MFGKAADGTRRWWAVILLGPYLVYTWLTWHILWVLSRESPQNKLTPRTLIGRRLLFREIPADVELIVDLTCEMLEPAGVIGGRCYKACPILDGFIPREEPFLEWMLYLRDYPGTLLIHCAQGHGRTGLVAAALLLAKGIAGTPSEAISQIQAVRPSVHLNRMQRLFLDRVADRCRNVRSADPESYGKLGSPTAG